MRHELMLAIAALSVVACGREPATPESSTLPEPSAAPQSTAASAATTMPSAAADAPAADAGSGELIGVPITEAKPEEKKSEDAARDAQLAAAVLMKSEHRACLKASRQTKPNFKPVHYEVVLVLSPTGAIKSLNEDQRATKVDDPAFMPCVLKKLRAGIYPAPGREVTVRLVYPE